jgi:hypothetical protein
MSIATLSQTMRPSTRFGLGTRPSLTISSNFVVPTLAYPSPATRQALA